MARAARTEYTLVDSRTMRDSGTFASTTPRGAAEKACSALHARGALHAGDSQIWITAGGKLHIYHGEMQDIPEHRRTEFTRRHNITQQPVVRKVRYVNLTKMRADAQRAERVSGRKDDAHASATSAVRFAADPDAPETN